MRPIGYNRCPENFGELLTTFPKIFHGHLFRSTLWMHVQNLKKIVLIGGTQKLDTPTLPFPFLQNFNGLLFGGSYECTCQICFTRSWDNRGLSKNVDSPWLCPHSLFPPNPIGLLYRLFLYVDSFSHNFRLEFWVGVANPQFLWGGNPRESS